MNFYKQKYKIYYRHLVSSKCLHKLILMALLWAAILTAQMCQKMQKQFLCGHSERSVAKIKYHMLLTLCPNWALGQGTKCLDKHQLPKRTLHMQEATRNTPISKSFQYWLANTLHQSCKYRWQTHFYPSCYQYQCF